MELRDIEKLRREHLLNAPTGVMDVQLKKVVFVKLLEELEAMIQKEARPATHKQIILDPRARPETFRAAEPISPQERVRLYEEVLAQHGLEIREVTNKTLRTEIPGQAPGYWFALTKMEEP